MIKKTTLSILFLIVSLFVVKLFAQAAFRGTPTKNYNDNLLLHAMLTEYAVFNINSTALKQYVRSNEFTKFSLNLVNTKNWDINLFANDIRSEQYKLIIGDAEGDHILPKGENITYKGYTNDNQEVRMTINDNFIVAYVFGDKEAYYIEPLQRFIAEAPNDTYIFYNVAHIIPDANMKCGVVETIERQKQVQAQIQAQANERSIVPQGCVNVNLAIASLYDMYTAFSSNTTNVTNQTIAVTNNVITDYDNDFSKVINYTIVANYVSTSASSALDAAITSSDNGNMMLCNFSNWASTGGFGVAHDLGSLWTDRNFASGTNYSTVGLAYVGGVCTPYSYNLTTTNNECSVNVSNVSVRYNLLEDFTTTMSNLRNMVSHEYGHNWGCSHDAAGSTTIMAPSVNGSVTWSSTSISSVNTQEASTNCNFGTTALVGTPNVLFNVPNGVCINQSVSLLGTSGRTVTS